MIPDPVKLTQDLVAVPSDSTESNVPVAEALTDCAG